MRQFVNLVIIFSLSLLIACNSDDQQLSSVQLRFDNVVGSQAGDILSPIGSQNFPFTNSVSQTYNVTLMKYIISEIELSGPNGALYKEEIEINLEQVKGAYVLDETKPLSLLIDLDNVPVGNYNQLSFTLGVEEEFVQQGATVLLDNMFWAWNAGYIAFKIEGQSPDSKGDDFGDGNSQGWSYHIGGWQTPNNNRRLNINLGTLQVTADRSVIGLKADGASFLAGPNTADFSDVNSVHDPGSGEAFADNMLSIFSLDYVE